MSMSDRRTISSKRVYEAEIVVSKVHGASYSSIMGKIKSYKRSTVEIKETAGTFAAKVRAADATALRASVNALMRDIQVIERISRIK